MRRLTEWLPFAGSSYDVIEVDVFDGEALAAALAAIRGEGYAGVGCGVA